MVTVRATLEIFILAIFMIHEKLLLSIPVYIPVARMECEILSQFIVFKIQVKLIVISAKNDFCDRNASWTTNRSLSFQQHWSACKLESILIEQNHWRARVENVLWMMDICHEVALLDVMNLEEPHFPFWKRVSFRGHNRTSLLATKPSLYLI